MTLGAAPHVQVLDLVAPGLQCLGSDPACCEDHQNQGDKRERSVAEDNRHGETGLRWHDRVLALVVTAKPDPQHRHAEDRDDE
jgi:hypothetical protein